MVDPGEEKRWNNIDTVPAVKTVLEYGIKSKDSFNLKKFFLFVEIYPNTFKGTVQRDF